MQKVVASVARDGSVLSQAEEVTSIEVSLCAEGVFEVRMSFIPFRSLNEWFYVFSANDGCEPVLDLEKPIFSAGAFKLLTEPLPSKFRNMAHLPVKIQGGVAFACQNLIILRNYVHLQVELHKPGTKLIGLDVTSDYPTAHAQWWTWNPPVTKARKMFKSSNAIRLRAQRPSVPVPSPALMDILGANFADEGHAITLLFADLPDFDVLSVDASDKARQIVLHAHFDDDSLHTIDIMRHFHTEPAEDPWIQLVQHHLEEMKFSTTEHLTFLEVGARGEASAKMRELMSASEWNYLGLDISAHSNVDIVSDAHNMGPQVAKNSIAVVYSSEVIEHLVSPLHFVLEANRVLSDNGLFIARGPCIWPLHAEPWDFWRFSQHGWQGLLNPTTGFEILEACEFGEACVVPSLPIWTGGHAWL